LDNVHQGQVARFTGFELDLRTAELCPDGGMPIGLGEKPFRILTTLLQNPRDLVRREELREKLWPNGTIVEFEHSINAAVNRLRQVLDDSADKPRYIETLPRRGYRWLVPVEWVEGQPRKSRNSPTAVAPSARPSRATASTLRTCSASRTAPQSSCVHSAEARRRA
jgi:DNA-binding winged helix-turn-helix (wHTH) protein